ncbi:MAG: hypothetical protein E7041_01300 [Lentisphaerae bacterium]|nr:hypothetical protein [Lentisphaerota bacterium]
MGIHVWFLCHVGAILDQYLFGIYHQQLQLADQKSDSSRQNITGHCGAPATGLSRLDGGVSGGQSADGLNKASGVK